MPEDLPALHAAETALMRRVDEFTGTIEQKSKLLLECGIPADYVKVYEGYIDLLGSPEEGLEALKRALFLYWYEYAEPGIYTGLSGLAESEATRKLFNDLADRIDAGRVDAELQWMLRYYCNVADWPFEPQLHRPGLRLYFDARPGLGEYFTPSDHTEEEFEARGQMGEYFRSLIFSALQRQS